MASFLPTFNNVPRGDSYHVETFCLTREAKAQGFNSRALVVSAPGFGAIPSIRCHVAGDLVDVYTDTGLVCCVANTERDLALTFDQLAFK